MAISCTDLKKSSKLSAWSVSLAKSRASNGVMSCFKPLTPPATTICSCCAINDDNRHWSHRLTSQPGKNVIGQHAGWQNDVNYCCFSYQHVSYVSQLFCDGWQIDPTFVSREKNVGRLYNGMFWSTLWDQHVGWQQFRLFCQLDLLGIKSVSVNSPLLMKAN